MKERAFAVPSRVAKQHLVVRVSGVNVELDSGADPVVGTVDAFPVHLLCIVFQDAHVEATRDGTAAVVRYFITWTAGSGQIAVTRIFNFKAGLARSKAPYALLEILVSPLHTERLDFYVVRKGPTFSLFHVVPQAQQKCRPFG